ncbi:MAG: hypothetical protein OEX22_10645 [Cyclobacteriaceae bacterium]|nr:hypothetical protein [Cyclobacteriaceae bacterium]
MSALSQLQIELIRGDIRQNGVELVDLEEDLLDHICCTIEEQLDGTMSFEELYQSAKKKVFPNGYREIQEATNYLITQKYNNMKKTMNVLGIAGSALFLIGSIMKTLHLAGSNELLALGTASLVLGYLPLMLVLSLQQTDLVLGKLRNMSGYLGATAIVLGVFLQILHFSGGKLFFLVGVALFLLVFVPLFIKSVGKESMMKIQPTTLSVLLIAMVSALFAFNNKQPSTAYINSLLAVNNSIEASYTLKKERLVKMVNAQSELAKTTEETLAYIDKLKYYIVTTVDNKSTDGKLKSYNVTLFNDVTNDILIDNSTSHSYNGKALQQHVEKVINILKKENSGLKTILLAKGGDKSWTETHFKNKTLYGIYTTLSSFQLEIVSLEMETINSK